MSESLASEVTLITPFAVCDKATQEGALRAIEANAVAARDARRIACIDLAGPEIANTARFHDWEVYAPPGRPVRMKTLMLNRLGTVTTPFVLTVEQDNIMAPDTVDKLLAAFHAEAATDNLACIEAKAVDLKGNETRPTQHRVYYPWNGNGTMKRAHHVSFTCTLWRTDILRDGPTWDRAAEHGYCDLDICTHLTLKSYVFLTAKNITAVHLSSGSRTAVKRWLVRHRMTADPALF